jgi:hypothetical protein
VKKIFSLSVKIVLAMSVSLIAQSTIGPNFAGTGVTGGGTGVAWTDPGNISVDDNSYATASSITTDQLTQVLQATNFGFSIPSDATLAGIEVIIARYSPTTDPNIIRDNSVRLLKSGSPIGTNKAITGTNWPNNTEGVGEAIYGSSSDSWGTTWTPAEINSSDFGVELIATNIGYNAHTASVDYIQITVYLAGPPADEPTVQASDVTFSSIGSTQITINWVSGDGSNRLVLIKAGSQVDSDPVDGISYTANTTFGNGSQIGSGNYVVYNGTGNSVTVTGLSANTTYHVTVYEFNGAGGSQNYLTTNPAVNSQLTLPTPVNFIAPELLGRPTNHSITLNVVASTAIEAYVKYGISSGTYTDSTSAVNQVANEPIEILIDELSSDTKYYYRLVYSSDGGTTWLNRDEHSFRTQRPPGSTFTFTIVTDSHFGQYGGQTADELALYTRTLQNVQLDNPDLYLDLGDTFAMDPQPLGTGMTEAEADNAYLIQRPYLGQICHSIPFLFALGNHENEEGWNFDDVFTPPDQSLAIVGLKARKKYFPNPIPDDFYTGNEDPLSEPIGGDTYREDYFAWEWGDVLFVFLDPFHYTTIWPSEGDSYGGEGQDGEASGTRWDWTLGIEQYLWLKSTLENSNATFKFVFSHHVTGGNNPYGRGGIITAPYYEWGGKNADDTWGFDTHRPAAEGWDMPIHQLMVANGVSVYFHGHDHMYAYEQLDGIHYLECPKPDDAGYTWQPYSYGYIEGHYPDAVQIQNSGHIRVVVSPDSVNVSYVRSYLPGDGTNGNIAHSFTINPISITVNTKVFLEGPYLGSNTMGTELNTGPDEFLENNALSQSYNASPWNYNGIENVAAGFFSSHTDIVDWVLIEIKNSSLVTVGKRAAFLKSDGSIVDLDGTSPVEFKGRPAGDYYIVIRHRNHLAVMSLGTVSLSGSSPLYDFTTGSGQYYGGVSAANEIETGVWGMIAGDGNGNGQVQNNDSEDIWKPDNGLSGYRNSDFNMNGQVQNNDNEDYWKPNNGKGSQVP